MDPANNLLADLVRAKIRRDGPVRFDWFMEQALYHPELGYYGSGKCQIGRRGDYFTNVSVGPLFGRILASQFEEMWESLDRPRDFTIVEQGAHEGHFASDVLKAARDHSPDFFSAVQYVIIEPFPVLETRQKDRLRDLKDKVSWRKSLAEAASFNGVHFSNELLDSMPVRLIRRQGDEWKERLVDTIGDEFGFVTQSITDEKLSQYLAEIPLPDTAAYETEINLAARDWIEAVAGKLNRGFLLAVDYGYPRTEFFATERMSGTLQCRARHRVVDSPLLEIGRADITAHIDWTSIAERAEQQGLVLAGFTDQHHFVTGMLTRVTPDESERRAVQTLLHPELLGTRFQYLLLRKNVPDKELTGFRFVRDARKALGLQ